MKKRFGAGLLDLVARRKNKEEEAGMFRHYKADQPTWPNASTDVYAAMGIMDNYPEDVYAYEEPTPYADILARSAGREIYLHQTVGGATEQIQVQDTGRHVVEAMRMTQADVEAVRAQMSRLGTMNMYYHHDEPEVKQVNFESIYE